MASVTFKRGTRAEIEATAKQDGQILMETDQTNNKMYVDLQNNNRVRIGNSNVDDISGITDSLTATSSNIALSAAGGNNLQGQIDALNSNLLKKLSAEVILNASNYMLLKINNGYIFTGYFVEDVNAWTWIVKLDEKYKPIRNITTMDGKIQLDTSGVIQSTTNISGGTSYILFYTIV